MIQELQNQSFQSNNPQLNNPKKLMEKKENYTYGVAYKLYAIENGEKTMLE